MENTNNLFENWNMLIYHITQGSCIRRWGSPHQKEHQIVSDTCSFLKESWCFECEWLVPFLHLLTFH